MHASQSDDTTTPGLGSSQTLDPNLSALRGDEQQLSPRKRKYSEFAANDSDPRKLTVQSERGTSSHSAQDQEGTNRCYCAVCKAILSVSDFYPSYVQRRLACCKHCARGKQTEHKRNKQRVETVRPDHGRSMLERLRRRCSLSSRLEGCNKPLIVGFDVKVARLLLAIWEWQSALQTAEKSDETAPDSKNTVKAQSAKNVPLRWIVWGKTDASPIAPWEVIPVTCKESTLFRNVPIAMRSQLIPKEIAHQVALQLLRLREICSSEPGLTTCNLLERHIQNNLEKLS